MTSERKNPTNAKRARDSSDEESTFCSEKNHEEKSKGAYVQLDGSLLEGGGQILRNSFGYSALLKTPISINKIRANRQPKGGLKMQHLTGIRLVQQMVGGSLEHAELLSSTVSFSPGDGQWTFGKDADSKTLHFEADTKTAGATMLLFQIALPVMLFLPYPTRLLLRGGTNAIKAPLFDYATHVFAPTLKRLTGLDVRLKLLKRGYFPRGGGEVEVRTAPQRSAIPAFTLTERGSLRAIRGLSIVSGRVPVSVAERMSKAAVKAVRRAAEVRGSAEVTVELDPRLEHKQVAGYGDGVFILLVAETSTGCLLATSALGEKGKPAEQVGEEAGLELVANLAHGGCVDEYLADQLIIYMALSQGTSTIKTGPLSLHTQTAIHFAQLLTAAKFSVTKCKPEDGKDHTFLISCEGIGYQSRFKPLEGWEPE